MAAREQPAAPLGPEMSRTGSSPCLRLPGRDVEAKPFALQAPCSVTWEFRQEGTGAWELLAGGEILKIGGVEVNVHPMPPLEGRGASPS